MRIAARIGREMRKMDGDECITVNDREMLRSMVVAAYPNDTRKQIEDKVIIFTKCNMRRGGTDPDRPRFTGSDREFLRAIGIGVSANDGRYPMLAGQTGPVTRTCCTNSADM